MKVFYAIFFFVVTAAAAAVVTNIGKLNLVKVDVYDTAYKRLMITEEGILSAPPLALLDVLKLNNYHCFKNIRSNKWSLAIPIIFWNQTYIDNVTSSINMVSFYKKFKSNISSLILPPSGILAYRLNWRRKSETIINNNINIDSSWYTTQYDYVLPKTHNFIIEFDSSNGTIDICNSTKKKLIDEVFQSQELAVVFMTRKIKSQNLSTVEISIMDLKLTKMFNDTRCESKETCFVSYKYAEKWSYEVSANAMERLNTIHLTLQKDLYDAILNYLCKNKVPISEIESKTISKLVKDPSNEMGCSIEKKVYSSVERLCRDQVFVNSYYNGCENRNRHFQAEVIVSMNSTKIFDDRNMFTLPLKRL